MTTTTTTIVSLPRISPTDGRTDGRGRKGSHDGDGKALDRREIANKAIFVRISSVSLLDGGSDGGNRDDQSDCNAGCLAGRQAGSQGGIAWQCVISSFGLPNRSVRGILAEERFSRTGPCNIQKQRQRAKAARRRKVTQTTSTSADNPAARQEPQTPPPSTQLIYA